MWLPSRKAVAKLACSRRWPVAAGRPAADPPRGNAASGDRGMERANPEGGFQDEGHGHRREGNVGRQTRRPRGSRRRRGKRHRHGPPRVGAVVAATAPGHGGAHRRGAGEEEVLERPCERRRQITAASVPPSGGSGGAGGDGTRRRLPRRAPQPQADPARQRRSAPLPRSPAALPRDRGRRRRPGPGSPAPGPPGGTPYIAPSLGAAPLRQRRQQQRRRRTSRSQRRRRHGHGHRRWAPGYGGPPTGPDAGPCGGGLASARPARLPQPRAGQHKDGVPKHGARPGRLRLRCGGRNAGPEGVAPPPPPPTGAPLQGRPRQHPPPPPPPTVTGIISRRGLHPPLSGPPSPRAAPRRRRHPAPQAAASAPPLAPTVG
ncbi:hypothetical protein I4F81_010752 [Pyropia yezoensis]|uniref:Uncharacterized protein n=1 Tax=Pyropia yezoensis TaxID=2788 RepID=A0ACC3CDK8_PYRYE|nr:hypothetical protein I4F81_010752 [Neopyropia yezoensis]